MAGHQHQQRSAWLLGGAAAVTCAAAAGGCYIMLRRRRLRKREPEQDSTTISAYESLIGDTPCVLLPRLSLCFKNVEIYVKLESSNPGGTGKDRAARAILAAAFAEGKLPPPFVGKKPKHGATVSNNSVQRKALTATTTNNSTGKQQQQQSNNKRYYQQQQRYTLV